MHKIKYLALVLSLGLFTQCELEYDDYKTTDAEVDFSNFVAVGDSYTAGYTDGALGRSGQENGFSYILAKQLECVGCEGYVQPLVQSNGSIGSALNSYYQLQVVNNSISPVAGAGDQTIFAERVYNAECPIQNLGVPGAKSFHLLATAVSADPLMYYSQANPFFGRFASSTETSVIADAVAQNPTFISLWIGNNDVLTYALAGGESDEVTPSAAYAQYMSVIASSLFANGTKGAIANIPNIETIPYFSYIKYNALVIDQATADLLNAGYAQYNEISELYGFDKIEFVAGANAFVVEDEEYAHPAKIRQLKQGEKILLSASSGITNAETGWGSKQALDAKYVLDLDEIGAIKAATTAYNSTIASIATQYGLALVDLNALMDNANSNGYVVDGNLYTSTFVSGGIFSLDGIHATGRGSAIIANEFIKEINNTYNSSIPYATVNEYSSVVYP